MSLRNRDPNQKPIKAGPAAPAAPADMDVSTRTFTPRIAYTPELREISTDPESPQVIVVLAHNKNIRRHQMQQELFHEGFEVKVADNMADAATKIIGAFDRRPIVVLDAGLKNRQTGVHWRDIDALMETISQVESPDDVNRLGKVLIRQPDGKQNTRWRYDVVLDHDVSINRVVREVQQLARNQDRLTN